MLGGMQKVAREDGPGPASDGIPTLLTHPHLFPSVQVGGHLGWALVIVVQHALGEHLVQDGPVLVDGQVDGGVRVHRHEGQEKTVHASHRSCEDACVRVVAVADVGDDVVKLQRGVGHQRDASQGSVALESHRECHW